MRNVVLIAAGLLVIGCGPDPNAQLPGVSGPAQTGGTPGSGGATTGNGGTGGTTHGSGGTVGSGGMVDTGGTTTSQGGTGGINPFMGGTTGSTGGIVSSGGTVGSGGLANTGGRVGSGGVASSGGTVGSGGVMGSGGVTSIDGGGEVSTAACADAKPISVSVTFNTVSAFCFVTCDLTTDGWGCDSFTEKDRTVTVNGKPVTCGGTLPAANTGGYYYFEIGAGGQTWDAIHVNGPKAASCPVPAGGFAP